MKTNLTHLTSVQPWGLFRATGSRVLCSDGKVRSLSSIAQTADTFFSIPATVKVTLPTGERVSVSGYVTTCADRDGGSVPDGETVVCFRHHTRHADKLPAWPQSYTPEIAALLARAFTP